jgi:hypothetical protein
MKFAIEQHVFTVETFARKKTYRKCIRKFRRKYAYSAVLTKSCAVVCIQACEKVEGPGSVCAIKKQSKRIMQTEEKVRNIEARLSSKIVKALSTGNRCFPRICFHRSSNTNFLSSFKEIPLGKTLLLRVTG